MSDRKTQPRRRPVARATNPAFQIPELPPEVGELADVVPPARAEERVEPHIAQIAILAQVLLGAAHADGFYTASEAVTIAQILSKFVDLDPLPRPVQRAMREFDPKRFDVAGACAQLTVETARDRRELLDLTSRVTDADQRLDAAEGNYLRRVARAIGAELSEYADLLAGEVPPPLPVDPNAARFDEANPLDDDDPS